MKAFYRSQVKLWLLDNPLNVLKSASTDTCHHVQMCEFFFLYSLKHVHPIQLIINIFPHPDPHSSHLLHLLSPSLFSSHFPMQMITYSSHQKGNSFMVTNYVWMHCLFMGGRGLHVNYSYNFPPTPFHLSPIWYLISCVFLGL